MTEPSNLPESIPAQADPHVDDLTFLHGSDREAISDLFCETMMATPFITEQQMRRAEFANYAGELAFGDRIQRQADLDLELVRNYTKEDSSEPKKQEILLSAERIGWLGGDQPLPITLEEISAPGSDPYLFGSIVARHKVTQGAMDHLAAEGLDQTLLDVLKSHGIPRFLEDLKSNTGKLRPINYTGEHSKKKRALATSYSAYMLDVQGTNNGAILFLPERIENQQPVVLAALFDREDVQKILRVLNV